MAIIVKSRDSLLTTSSGYTNYRGILNLVIILLVLSNARAALENIIKYGILVDPLSWFLFIREESKHGPALTIIFTLGIHILISYLIELLCSTKYNANKAKQQQAMSLNTNGKTTSSPANSLNSNNNNNNNNINSSNLRHTNSASKSSKSNGNSNSNSNGKPPTIDTHKSPSSLLTNLAISLNLLACLSIPPMIVYSNDTHVISTSASLMLVSIVFLKLVSYHMMNFWCRDIRLNGAKHENLSKTTKSFLRSYLPPEVDFIASKDDSQSVDTEDDDSEDDVKEQEAIKLAAEASKLLPPSESILPISMKALSKYPANVTISNIITYMSFPTLCYELEHARTRRIRKRFLVKRIIELIILTQLDMALVQQWIVPTVNNSLLPFRQMQFSHMLERLLKLAIPNHVIWLIWFYLFFHSLLNIIAELTRFADREFYRDWWNSESVDYFWSNWNRPVHKWCARHLYVPLLALGLSKCQASTAVFFVSAFFHEYLVSVPLKMFRMWAFTGMLIQLPWAKFVSSYFNNHFANVAVWVSLIIGQPLCILMYYHDYYVMNSVNFGVKPMPSR